MSRAPALLLAGGLAAGLLAGGAGGTCALWVGAAWMAVAAASRGTFRTVAVLGLAGFAAGLARVPAPPPAGEPPPGVWRVEGRLLDHARPSGTRWRFPLRIEAAARGAEPVADLAGTRVMVDAPAGAVTPGWGARVRLRGTFRPLPGYENPGLFSYPAYLRRQGIRWWFEATARPDPAGGAGWWLGALRDRMRGALAAGAGRHAPLLQALALGDAGALDPAQRDLLAASGLAHAVAASGLHAGVVAWLADRLAAGLAPVPRLVAVVAGTGGYAVLVGPAPSLLRATATLGLARALRLLGRPAEPLAATAAAGAALLLADPRALYDLGFQLSFAAAGGMVLLVPDPVPDPRGRGPRRRAGLRRTLAAAARRAGSGAARSLLVSAAAQLAVLPLLAAGWGEVAQLAPLSNAIALPPLVALMPGALAAALAAAVWVPAGRALAAVLSWPAAWCDGLVAWLGSLPGARRPVAAAPGWVYVLYWLALAWVAGDARHALVRRRRPVPVRPAAWLAALALAAGVWGWRPAAPPAGLEVTFLDVGQGDGMVIRAPPGVVMVVDAGESPAGRPRAAERALLPYLRRLGVRRVDLLVASHYDADHAGGLPALAASLPVRWLVHPGAAAVADAADLALLRALEAAPAGARRVVTAPGEVPLGDALVQVLPPAPPGLAGNEASLALRLCYAGRAVLLTGDAGLAREGAWVRAGAPLRAEVLKVGHHGSAGGTGEAFLQRVRPRLAVIQVGRGNRYGLPNGDVVRRLQAAGARVYRTDRDGAVQVRVDRRGGIAVRTARAGWRREVERRAWRWSTSTRYCGASPPGASSPSTW